MAGDVREQPPCQVFYRPHPNAREAARVPQC
jgi:hypothetical protein